MAAVGYSNPYIGVESGDDVVLKRINKGYIDREGKTGGNIRVGTLPEQHKLGKRLVELY